MTTVGVLTTSKGALLGFTLQGHAGYGEAGEDIVCAAISSAIYLVANTVTEVLQVPAVIQEDEVVGSFLLRVTEEDASVCRDLFLGLKLHMQGLEEQYPKFIQVHYVEVRSNA